MLFLPNVLSCFLSHSLFQTASSAAGGLTDQERREKKALEKKLSEMEEELKVSKLSKEQ